jgi:hypothetical protein
VGAGTYTKDYGKSWVISSAYHNMLPIVNGEVQLTGRKYAASAVSYTSDAQKIVFKQDISKTYNEDLGMRKWERTITHNKGKSIVIADNFDFSTTRDAIILPMMLVSRPDITAPGKMLVKTGDAESVTISFDQQQFELSIEEINIQDAKISHTWGSTIYRAQFRMKNKTSKGKFQFTIQ